MLSHELLDIFRRDVADYARPYLWSDEEAYAYMDDAYSMFVRLTGGIADITSAATEVAIVAGEPKAELSPKILRVMGATRRSDGAEIEILNATDFSRVAPSDYGRIKPLLMDTSTGPVVALVIGQQTGVGRWIHVPEADDTADLRIYRLPLESITGENQEFVGVEPHHHFHLMKWMKALAYQKQDAETFDRNAAADNETRFRLYCEQSKAEWERSKHKTRVVAYGGL